MTKTKTKSEGTVSKTNLEYLEFMKQKASTQAKAQTKKRPAKKAVKKPVEETPKAEVSFWPGADPTTGRPKDDPQYPRQPELMTQQENEVGMRIARAQIEQALTPVAQGSAPKSIDSYPEFLTPQDVQAILRISRATFFRLVTANEIPGAFKIGKSWRIDRDKLRKMTGR